MAIFFDVTGRVVSKDRLEELREENTVSDTRYWLVMIIFMLSAAAAFAGIAVVGLAWFFTRGPGIEAFGLWGVAIAICAYTWYEQKKLDKRIANSKELKDVDQKQLAELANVFSKYDFPKLKATREAVVAQGRAFCVGEYRGILRYVKEESQRQRNQANEKTVYG